MYFFNWIYRMHKPLLTSTTIQEVLFNSVFCFGINLFVLQHNFFICYFILNDTSSHFTTILQAVLWCQMVAPRVLPVGSAALPMLLRRLLFLLPHSAYFTDSFMNASSDEERAKLMRWVVTEVLHNNTMYLLCLCVWLCLC